MIDKRLKQIADHYGLDSQLDMLQEECAELIQAASKYKRNGNYSIIEEIADVYIMLDQVVYLLDKELPEEGEVKYSISWWKKKKISRQLERIEKEKNNDDG